MKSTDEPFSPDAFWQKGNPMFQPDMYIAALTEKLQSAFADRLVYVGLQGSYLRGEATEDSDIDVMVVLRHMTPADLDAYRRAIEELPDVEKSCGFICGLAEMQHWNPLEICHLLHTTRDCFGALKPLVPAYTAEDVRTFVKMSLGNLYHELCHRYIHAPKERSIQALPFTYKAVFFILQNLHYLRSGCFVSTKQSLLWALTGQDKEVLETAMTLQGAESYDFDAAFQLLFTWCQHTLNTI